MTVNRNQLHSKHCTSNVLALVMMLTPGSESHDKSQFVTQFQAHLCVTFTGQKAACKGLSVQF